MSNQTKVYIASPYSSDPLAGVQAQIEAFSAIRNLGMLPFAPLLFHYVDAVHPRPYEDWIAQCLQWVAACDMMVRFPGESSGADREVLRACELGKIVCYSLEQLKAYA